MKAGFPSAWLAGKFGRFDRLITYVLVGSVIALIQILLTATLARSGAIAEVPLASVAASCITIPLAFFLHKRTTYADVARERFQGARFVATAIASIVIAAGAIKIAQSLGAPFWFAIILGSALVPVGNYIINTLWVFRARSFFSLRQNP
jgi:putative flippase GtrA